MFSFLDADTGEKVHTFRDSCEFDADEETVLLKRMDVYLLIVLTKTRKDGS